MMKKFIIWKKERINNWKKLYPRSDPIIYKKSIIFGTSESKIVCLEIKTGEEIWSYKIKNKIIPGRDFRSKGILSTPIIYNNRVFIGGNDGFLYCFDADNGEKIWERFVTEWISSSPCVYRNLLYVGLEYGTDGGSLCAYSVKDGTLRWELRTNYHVESSPEVDRKRGIVICGSNDNFVYAANSKSGALLWKINIGKETKSGFVIDESTGFVYFGSLNGLLYCVNIINGDIIWYKKISSKIFVTPEIEGTKIIIGTISKKIHVLDKRNGNVLWEYIIQNKIYCSTRTIENTIYFGCEGGYSYVLNLKTKKLVQKTNVGFPILTKAIVVQDKIIFGGKGYYTAIIKPKISIRSDYRTWRYLINPSRRH